MLLRHSTLEVSFFILLSVWIERRPPVRSSHLPVATAQSKFSPGAATSSSLAFFVRASAEVHGITLRPEPFPNQHQTASRWPLSAQLERSTIMPLIQILEVLIVVGVLLWLVNRFIPMQGSIKSILNGVVVIAGVLWLLNIFGLFHSISNIHVGKG